MSTIVITGASSGLGAVAAQRLAERGWDVAVVGRNPERTAAVAERVGGTAFLADYSRLDDVRALAAALLERYPRIDVLANNAGGLVSSRITTTDGHDLTIQQNHLAPFLLTNLLLPRLEQSGGRVLSTGSVANLWGSLRLDNLDWAGRPWQGGWRPYGTSKLATIIFARELAARSSVESYSFHPGFVATRFGSESPLMRFAAFVGRGHLGISPEQGAAPLIHLATADPVGQPNGTYFDGLKPNGRVQKLAKDPTIGARLWDATAEIVGLAASDSARQ